ncbi:MAG: enoyl-CoA hydratase-related protein [Rhodospirillales bacterium]|nr:enoyl-CoA hydratase-related protein [Rhodospirillales bacterium]
MSSPTKVTQDGAVLEIVLDRPPANAIDLATSYALYGAFKRLNEVDELRVGIITGGDNDKKIFSAGWDLKAVAAGEGRSEEEGFDLGPGGIGGLTEYWDLYKPVIAAVNGLAVGGGFELALGADIIVASDDAEFFLPEMQRGFLPDGGAIQKLHHRIPYNVAMDLMFTGRRMGAAEAKHWGLVRDVVPREGVMDRAREIARTIAAGAPLVTRALKEFMRHNAHGSPEAAHAATRRAWIGKSGLAHYEAMMFSEDFNEGAQAFAEKRKPDFQGQ